MSTFYSCLYRSLLFPRRFYEINGKGEVVHYSPYNGQVLPGYLYTDTGYWDTFRALMPLIHLVYPEEGAKMAEGMMNAYRESGFFPEWASLDTETVWWGNNSASVIADAFVKGLGRIDPKELTTALLHGANNEHPNIRSTGRLGYKYYNKLGYIPSDVGIQRALQPEASEYAYDDWCILRPFRRLEPQLTSSRLYAERAMNYPQALRPQHRLDARAPTRWLLPVPPSPSSNGEMPSLKAIHSTTAGPSSMTCRGSLILWAEIRLSLASSTAFSPSLPSSMTATMASSSTRFVRCRSWIWATMPTVTSPYST